MGGVIVKRIALWLAAWSAFCTLLLPTMASAETWQIDSTKSKVTFKVVHMLVTPVTGGFNTFTGNVVGDSKDLTKVKVQASINTASISTGDAKRDQAFKSAEYLDVAKYPAMTFVSTKIAAAGANKYRVTGDLTLHGVTKSIAMDFTVGGAPQKDAAGKLNQQAKSSITLKRKDFGIAPTVQEGVVANPIEVKIELTLKKQ